MAKVPQLVSWAGLRDEALSKTRACIRELTAELRTLTLGYEMVREQFSTYPALLMVSFDSLAKMVYLVWSQMLDFAPRSSYLKST